MHNHRPQFDPIITDITHYVTQEQTYPSETIETAYYDLLDSMACAIMALDFTACTQLLGPIVPGAQLTDGVPIPGTAFTLDPAQAAFNIGALIRWLDFNDTWLAQEWGHPSDNIGTLLSITDYCSRHPKQYRTYTVKDLLISMIKAHEIQGVLALDNSFNRVGLDHVVLVKIASTALCTHLLGGNADQINTALSLAWVDGQSLRTYRHAPNTGSRKSWAAGDACRRSVELSLLTLQGAMGCPSALSAPQWGFQDVLFNQQPLTCSQPYQHYVMDNILWKIAFPAEFHAQTAAEAAIQLHTEVKGRMDDIERIDVFTQEAAMRIINKTGPLHNPADRDHSLQYIIAIGLIFGELKAEHYEDDIAGNPLIDALRGKMHVTENKQFSQDYLDPSKRAIANAIQIHFKDGTASEPIHIDFPIGHRRRREEGIPLLLQKFEKSIHHFYSSEQADRILSCCLDQTACLRQPISQWHSLFSLPE